MFSDDDAHQSFNYLLGKHLSLIRSKQTAQFGCMAQSFFDYLVLHYLLYQALYGGLSYRTQLEGDAYDDVELFYWHLSILTCLDQLLHFILWLASGCFYFVFARKEITFFSFYF